MAARLHRAVRSNDFGAVQRILSTGNNNDIDLNAIDSLTGQTALHTALSLAEEPAAEQMTLILLSCDRVDPNRQEEESGWTVMHSALYQGRLRLALLIENQCPRVDFESRLDFSGQCALQILMRSMRAASGDRSVINKRNSDLYTWGNNANYNLCLPDGDNRRNPELVVMKSKRINPESFTAAQLLAAEKLRPSKVIFAKYHTAILSDTGAVFLAGVGTGGKLGSGNENSRLVPAEPPLLESLPPVADVALGTHHSLLLLEDGSVLAFGRNQHFQLGLQFGDFGIESADFESLRSRIQTTPKRISALGRRLMLKGCAASGIHSVVFSSNSIFVWGSNRGQLGGMHVQKFLLNPTQTSSINFTSDEEIQSIMTTDSATVCLLNSGKVVVLSGYSCIKANFSPRKKIEISWWARKRSGNPKIRQIKPTQSDSEFIAIDLDNLVYFCRIIDQVVRVDRIDFFRQPIINLEINDIACSSDKTVAITSTDGYLYLGKIFVTDDDVYVYNLRKIPGIFFAASVESSYVGAFSVITTEEKRPPWNTPPIEPLCAVFRQKITEPSVSQGKAHILQGDYFSDIWLFDCDGRNLFCHMIVLAAKSPYFFRLSVSLPTSDDPLLLLKPHHNGESMKVVFKELTFDKICTLIDYFYFDRLPDLDGIDDKSRNLLLQYAKRFELDALAVYLENRFKDCKHILINESMPVLLNFPSNQMISNVNLKCKDGSIRLNRFVLCSRSEFFAAVLVSSSHWKVAHDNGTTFIDVSSITVKTMQRVAKFLYGNSIDAVFEADLFDNLSDFTQNLLDLLSASVELLIEDLMEHCDLLLAHTVHFENAICVLEYSIVYGSNRLKKICTEFITQNLDAFLFHKMLLNVDKSALEAIECCVRSKQLECFPYIRGKWPLELKYFLNRHKLNYNPQIIISSAINAKDFCGYSGTTDSCTAAASRTESIDADVNDSNSRVSFREIIEAEQRVRNSTASGIERLKTSLIIPAKISQKERKKLAKLPSVIAKNAPSWACNQVSNTRTVFLQVQKQQLEDKIKQVHASRRKSLIQIQSQEKALMELMEFYEISSGPFGGEWFEIL